LAAWGEGKRSFLVRIALVQQHATADKAENLRRGLAAAREAAARGADLICFAELAFEPFYPQHPAATRPCDTAEPIPGPITEAFCSLAKELGVVVVPNLYERAGEETFDTSPVIDQNGRILGVQRMIHIPDYPGFHETSYYVPGDQGAPVFATGCGRIGIAICYDRHFPEVMRALALSGAEIVLVPQAGAVGEWPDGLFEAEMRVAAFQNGYFVALCNRVGREDTLHFAGESFVCDPSGEVLARAASGEDDLLVCEIDIDRANASMANARFLPDRRPELYGSWIESRETPEPADQPSRDAVVSLREVSAETVRDIIRLSRTMAPGQERLVAANAVSIAQAHFNEHAWYRAIYADETPVGFVMLCDNPEDPRCYLWRLMITGPQQGKGYGRKAMAQVIEYVRSRPGAKEITASYVPRPGNAWPFYESLGFEKTGEVHDGETVIRLRV